MNVWLGRFTTSARIAALTCWLAWHPLPARALGETDVPPNFTLGEENGHAVSLSDFRGKVIYLDFWASWCGPCKQTLPWMQALQERFGSRGLEVVAVNLDTERTAADSLLGTMKRTFTVLFDPAGTVAGLYRIPAMPTSFIIDRSGRVTAVHAGFSDTDRAEIEREIGALVADRSSAAAPRSVP